MVEVKNTGHRFLDRWEDGKIADTAHAQGLHYLAVTGLDYVYFAVLVGGNQFISRRIDRNEAAIDILLQAEIEFHESLEANTPPAWSGNDEDLLSELYPADEAEAGVVELPSDADDWVQQYVQGLAVEKEGAKVKKEAQVNLCAMMEKNQEGFIGDSRVTWKTIKRSGYKVEEKVYRRFSVRA